MAKVLTTTRLALLAGLAGATLFGATAHATLVSIQVQETGGPTQTVTGLPGQVVTYTDAGVQFPDFSGISVTAAGNPPLSGNDLLFSFTLDTTATANAALRVIVTEQGISNVAGAGTTGFIPPFTTQFNANAPASFQSATESTYLDIDNGLFTMVTPLATTTFTTNGAVTTTTSPDPLVDDSYSVTEVYDIVFGPNGGNANLSIDLTSATCTTCGAPGDTPLPAAMPLLGSVLGGGLLFARLRNRKKAKA